MLPFLLFISTLMTQPSFYDITIKDINGRPVQLSDYKGKVVLVVNVASFCGFTKQYTTLEQLYKQYEGKGFVILGVPSNDFGAQEPGTEEEIKEFCSTKYTVSFPMFSKVTVKGADKHPLYAWLISGGGNEAFDGEVDWNFEKFLIDANGKVVGRYKSKADPMADPLASDVAKLVAQH